MDIKKSEYTHIGGRLENEDSVCCEILNAHSAYAAVADGLGGHGDGRLASQIAVNHLSGCARCTVLPSEEQIRKWLHDANEEILLKNKSAAGMKSTAVFLALFHNCAVWAHIGDSRLYHFYEGRMEHYTCDHSIPQIQVVAGELTRDQIPFSPDRNKVLQALGNTDTEPEISPAIQLQPGHHAFLLCTDGFWEYLSDEEIWLDLNKSESPAAWLTYLRCRGECRKGGDADNNTAVALFVDI